MTGAAAKRTVILAGLAGWLTMLTVAATATTPLRYDEPFYLQPARAFEQYGWSFELVRRYPEVTGLVHTAIHVAAAPITHLDVPGVRIVNALVMGAGIATTALLLFVVESGSAWFALTLLALPPVWVVGGMALTEPPAIALLALALAMFYATDRWPGRWHKIAGGGAAGLAFAAAVLAKQGTLAALAGIVWLAWDQRHWRLAGGSMLAVAACVLLPIFMAWGGLAPHRARELQHGSVFSISHAIDALGYAGLFVLVLAPHTYRLRVPTAIATLVLASAANIIFHFVEMRPFASVANRLLSANLLPVYDALAGAAIITLAALFVMAMAVRFRERSNDPVWQSMAIALVASVASLGAVTYSFSGRYVTILSPLIVVVSWPYRKTDRLWLAIILAAGASGLASLLAYLQYLPR